MRMRTAARALQRQWAIQPSRSNVVDLDEFRVATTGR